MDAIVSQLYFPIQISGARLKYYLQPSEFVALTELPLAETSVVLERIEIRDLIQGTLLDLYSLILNPNCYQFRRMHCPQCPTHELNRTRSSREPRRGNV